VTSAWGRAAFAPPSDEKDDMSVTITVTDEELNLLLDGLSALALRGRKADVYAFLTGHAELPLMAALDEPPAEEDR